MLPGVPTIAITLGDPAGIGPEIIDRALATGGWRDDIRFLILGDRSAGVPGKPTAQSAKAAWQALDESVELLRDGRADAVVTGPVAKSGLQAIGFPHPGQTEFYARAFQVEDFGMVLSGPHLTVGLATIHEPLAQVPTLLSTPAIVRIGCLTAGLLKRRHPGKTARIAVAGLNPHAGENGAFGDEEARVIAPAIAQLQALGVAEFSGPHVPDAVFRDAMLGRHDAVIAMYHDQGLIPLKLLDFEHAVNLTLGLPFVRTSPDHGTAFGIAGTGQADASSMLAAIRMACELV